MDESKENTDAHNEEDFSELIKEYDLKSIGFDTPVEGRIVDIIEDKVIVDIGHKTEGILNKAELVEWDGSFNFKVGDPLTVIPQKVNADQGYITVSKKELDKKEGWEKLSRAYEQNLSLIGKIVKVLPESKGFIVDMGIEVFLPMSQADIKKVKNPQKLLGKEYWFKVTKLNPKENSGVVSRKVILEEEKQEKIKNLFDSLNVGDIVKGVITTITDYGAFVNLGGVDGLVHKENISYGRVTHPKEKLRKGDEVEAKILEIERDKQKIALGIKQKYPDPWIDIEEKYPVGKKMVARVTKIVDFGAFIELEEGVEGLLHISDLTWEGKPTSVEEYVAVGDRLWVQVIELNKEEKKIKLGLKQLEMRPEEKYIEGHSIGETVKGVVKKILNSRVFIEVDKNVEGVVKISDITYFRIDTPKEYMKEGEEIEAMILSDELDSNYKVKLGIKHLYDREWQEFFRKNKPGNIIPVKIKKVTDKGVVTEISKNIEGFVKIGEVDDHRVTVEEVKENFKAGQLRDALITHTYPDKKRIYLSFRAVDRKKEREEIEKYMKSGNGSVTTIGDLLQNEIDKRK
jgi:small subunit ribosomal protein S1